MGIADIYNIFLQSLRLVGSSSKVQISKFPNFVNVPDEIALVYNDAYLLIPQLLDQNLISIEALNILKKLNELFDKMSKDYSLWALDKLENDENWKLSRELAHSALEALGESYDNPDLNFIQWVQ